MNATSCHDGDVTRPRLQRHRSTVWRIAAVGAAAVALTLAVTGCGSRNSPGAGDVPFTLPVGERPWDDVNAPSWLHDGTLHVGDESVELGREVGTFVLGTTGAYWMRGSTLMFTSADAETEEVEDVRWGNLAISADHRVFATVDQSNGPTDSYDTHVLQVAAFDTTTGEQLYRTPDEAPDPDDDLAALYPELMPLLHGVSNDRVFFYGDTIDLHDGTRTPVTEDADGLDVYEGYADTLFPLGYHVGLRGEGDHRRVASSTMWGTGWLSPDRSTIFDTGMWPTPAVAYDATSGEQRTIDAPWEHFVLAGWSDEDTFFGTAEHIDESNPSNVLRAYQVVTCETSTLACTPVSDVLGNDLQDGQYPAFLLEGSASQT